MKKEIVLMNFKLPVDLKDKFEACCREDHIPMSARLNLLIRDHVIQSHRDARRSPSGSWSDEPVSMFSDEERLATGPEYWQALEEDRDGYFDL
jgi:hypothetical protein